MTDFTGYSGQEAGLAQAEAHPAPPKHTPVTSIATRFVRARRLDNQVKRFWSKVDKNGTVPTRGVRRWISVKAVEKLREALATIAPRWKCEECSDVLEPGHEPESRYECGECGDDTLKENRCESCNKFAAKVSDTACQMEGCCGEMVLVGWETVIDLIAAKAKEEADEELRWRTELAAKMEFAKTKAGKAEAAKMAAERKAEDAARLKRDEDHTLELARLIAKGRAEGKTTEQVKRAEEKATRAENKARWAAQEAAWAAQEAVEAAAGASEAES
jgi:hypothetical protein